jgi:hypothetical protein
MKLAITAEIGEYGRLIFKPSPIRVLGRFTEREGL